MNNSGFRAGVHKQAPFASAFTSAFAFAFTARRSEGSGEDP